MQKLERIAVLGAGTMGARIAAQFANAGIPVLLLDLASEGGRSAIAQRGLENALRQRPPAFFTEAEAALVEPGNFDDDLRRIGSCQWIVEAVSENLDIKRTLWARVDRNRHPSAVLSTNTSGIPIAAISEGFSPAFRRQFLGTHFFNPPRYLHLLEVIPDTETERAVLDFVCDFGERVLGKGIVHAKDTPNFIANRMGAFYSAAIQRAMTEGDYTIEEADALTGPLLGMPKTAAFRLIDLIGVDVWVQVYANIYSGTNDRWCHWFALPSYMQEMLKRGWLGDKTAQGFYKREGKEILALDWKTLEYHPAQKPRWESVEPVWKQPLGERIRVLIEQRDRAGAFLWAVLRNAFAYAAEMIPTVAERTVEIDRAMRWGFGHKLGPFELWDAIGCEYVAKSMGAELPENIRRMLAAGAGSFYRPAQYFDLARTAWNGLKPRPGVLLLSDVKRERGVLDSNTEASLIDLRDGVLCLEFHSKMNAIGDNTIRLMRRAVKLLDGFSALVIANEGENFSVGANLTAILSTAQNGDFGWIERFIADFQSALLALKYAPKPVVSTGFARALGGGCEVILQSHRVQAFAELYIGLVELNVGLIPAGGGTKELAMRFSDPMKGLDLIANATVSSSAAHARQLGFLQPADRISMNPERLIEDAKRFALELAPSYQSGEPKTEIVVSGERGYGRMRAALESRQESGAITALDFTILDKAAWVLSGGRTGSTTVTEQHLLDLEREAFLALCGIPATHERIAYMLKNGKPLRN